MNKKIIPVLAVIVCLLGAYAVHLFLSDKPTSVDDASLRITGNDKAEIPTAEIPAPADEIVPQKVKVEEEKFTGVLDMKKWRYNSKDEVLYQTGIYYAQSSLKSEYQKMALFVPEKYLRCQKSNDGFYACDPNMASLIDGYTVRTAPIVTQISSSQFAAEPALNEYRSFKEYTDAGLIYAHIGFRGAEHGAPATVADIKAAIRFIKSNSERIPGNTESVFILAANHGGLLASIVGASGNDRSYTPYLQEIGAINNVEDNIKGVMVINPKGALDTANEALEWILNRNRQDLSEEQKKISDKMAKEYANYVNRAGFIGPRGEGLTLQYSQKGVYQDGTYYDYIKSIMENSLADLMLHNKFPYAVPKSWEISEDRAEAEKNIKLAGTYQSREKLVDDLNAKKVWVELNTSYGLKIKMASIRDFNNIFVRKHLPLASYDGFNKNNKENILFGLGDKKGLHFDAYTAKVFKGVPQGKEYAADLYKQDKFGYITLKRVNIFNPLYYLLSSYEGYKTSNVAPYWNIRTGVFQNNEPLTSSVNLFLAVNNHPDVKKVVFNPLWGMGDISEIGKKDRMDFISWINSNR